MILKNLNKEKYFCGLDLGAQRIKVSLIRSRDAGHHELVGVYETDTHGFKDGSVSDLGELSECIHSAVGKLAQKTGAKFKEVQLGIDGDLVQVRETNTEIPLIDKGSKVIARRDIQKLNKQARLLGIKMEEEILHDLPQRYLIDENSSALNPLGLYGRKLGVSSLLIIANANRVRNIIKAVNQAGLDVVNVFFGSYTSSDIALTPKEKDEGCVLIDIGARVTSVLIFKEGILRFVSKINLGGEHFTGRIADQLNLPFNLAEEIKKSYAVAIRPEHHGQEEILVKRENSYVPIKRELIYTSIEPAIEQLLESIQATIKDSNYHNQIDGGIVMVGGGSLLPGLMERIGEVTHLDVRLGKINNMAHTNLRNAAIYATVIGLARGGFTKSFGAKASSNGHAHWSKKNG